jgi:hypothetical protein
VLRKPDFRFLFKRDIPSAPEWVNNLLEPFNQIIQFLIDAFNGNIGAKNLSLQIIDFNFTAPFVERRFPKTKSDPIQGVWLVKLSGQDGSATGGNTGYDWREDDGNVVISGIYLIGAGNFNVKFFVMY